MLRMRNGFYSKRRSLKRKRRRYWQTGYYPVLRRYAYLKSHREYLASRMIMEALDMLAQAAWKQEEDFLDVQGMSGELSKEAKKELFLRNQDKGYEH